MKNNFTDLFLKNIFVLDDIYGASSHTMAVKISALLATLKNIELKEIKIQELISSVKNSIDSDSPFNKDQLLILSTLLHIHPHEEDTLLNINKIFNALETYFPSTSFLCTASEALYFYSDMNSYPNIIEKIRYTYTLLKERHWFITGSEDLSILALMASTFPNIPLKLEESEQCYKFLEEIKFFPSNNVQLLSQSLIFSDLPIESKCMLTIKLQGLLEKENYIIKNEALPILGFAAISLESDSMFINKFKEIDNILLENNIFNTYKLKEELRYLFSLSLTIRYLLPIEKEGLIDSLSVFLLTICTAETNSISENIVNKFFTD